MICKTCGHACIKNGFQTNGRQRYYCRSCKLHQQKAYTYRAYSKDTNRSIHKLLINSCGITDIARVLRISKNTVNSRILKLAAQIKTPVYNESSQNYELDELCTKVNGKQCWVSYAINRKTKQVINFVVGGRCKDNLAKVVTTLVCLTPKKIYTDRLTIYMGLIRLTYFLRGLIDFKRIIFPI